VHSRKVLLCRIRFEGAVCLSVLKPVSIAPVWSWLMLNAIAAVKSILDAVLRNGHARVVSDWAVGM
jgi:hypothetical protein